MNNIPFVELLLHPDNHLLAVRPSSDKNRNAIRWAILKETTYQSRTVSATAFLKTIYEIYGWKADCKYRIRGIRKQNADEAVYMFDLRETEIFIPTDTISLDNEETPNTTGYSMYSGAKPLIATAKTVCAYPAQWVETFGSDYYRHAQTQEMLVFSETGEWKSQLRGEAFNESPLQVTNGEEIEIHIAQIIEDMKQNGE